MEDDSGFPELKLLKDDAMRPRKYQERIMKEAVDKNVLVVLPTGLGKTLVSALVAAYLLENHADMKVLVMAPTRPLVAQHRDSFLDILKIDEDALITMTGQVPPRLREEIWEQGKVFFTTPQIVENDIAKGRLSLGDFSLVVFDEAHRAVKDYAYTAIAGHYLEEGAYPIILGLTASPGGSRERVREVCDNLSIEKLIYRTHEDEDVKPYVHRIDSDWREVELPEEYAEISRLLRTMLDDRVARVRAHHKVGGRFVGKRQLLDLGQKLRQRLKDAGKAKRGKLFGAIILQSAALSILHSIELLESQGIRPLLRFMNKLEAEKDEKRAYKNITKDPLFVETMKKAVEHKDVAHPKVEILKLEVIREFSRTGRDDKARVLVFTQYRDTASLLVNALKNDVFVVERFVGQASRLGDEGLDQAEQGELLDRFRKGEITVLVATSVAEEGLDIPNVDLVVFYEPVPSEIRFIQRKGRTGRKRVGRVVILATRDSVDMGAYFASQRTIEKMKALMRSIDASLKRVPRGKRPSPEELERSVRKKRVKRGFRRSSPPSSQLSTSPGITTIAPRGEHELVREWVLERLDAKGEVSVHDLLEECGEHGLDRAIVEEGLEMLEADNTVFRPSRGAIRRAAGTEGELSQDDVFKVKVVKAYQGGATLELDDGTYVLLDADDFPSSSAYIKKGKSFMVRGELYKSRGKKHIRVLEVLD
jgi:Fanconi anemia group M protein